MIILQTIKLNNFLSHSNTEINLEPNSHTLIDGLSGSGKSSIVESIIWGLYGKGRVEGRNLIRRGTKSASVIITLKDDKITYRIERKISEKGRQTLTIEEKKGKAKFTPIKVTGLKPLQDFIEKELLRSSYLLFINSVAYLQDNTDNFVKQTASKRKELLLEIVSASDYELYYNRARDLLILEKESKERFRAKLEEKGHLIMIHEEDAERVEEFKKKQKKVKADIEKEEILFNNIRTKKQNKNMFQAEYDRKESEILQINAPHEQKKMEIAEKKKKIEEIENIDTKEMNEKLEELDHLRVEFDALEKVKQAAHEWITKMNLIMGTKPSEHDYQSEIDELNRQIIAKMKGNDTYCQYIKGDCPRLVDELSKATGFLQEQIKIKETKIQLFSQEIITYKKKIGQLGTKPTVHEDDYIKLKDEIDKLLPWEEQKRTLEGKKELLEELKQTISTLEKEIEDGQAQTVALQGEMVGIEEELKNYEGINEQEQEVSTRYNTLSNDLVMVAQHLALAEKAVEIIKDTKVEIKKVKKDLAETRSKIELLKMIKEAFGPKGIKTVVIDYIIPKLEDKINEILGQLSDFRVHLETQRKGVSDNIVEGLFINIYNEVGESFEYSNYSGGEKLKITVAISEALSELQKIGFRILDELFVGLDEESTASFTNIMYKLQDRFSQMICISHLRSIKDSFSDKLLVSKINNISVVK